MNIQYASNLPTLNSFPLENGIHVLILSGNIGDPYDPMYEKLIKWCSNMVRHVLITAGSVEYHNRDKHIVDEHIESMVQRLNMTTNYGFLVYLQNNTFNVSNVEFIGTNANIAKEPEHIYGKDARYVFVTTDTVKDEFNVSLDCVISGNECHIFKSSCRVKSPNSFTIEHGVPVWLKRN
jgi:hypothetical protein